MPLTDKGYLTTWEKHDLLVDAGYVIYKDASDEFWYVANPAPDTYVVSSHRQKGPAVTEAWDLLN